VKKIIVLIIVFLFPAYSYAAYKIYLKNGSVISGASSYQEREGQVDIYFSTGSMTIPREDVLKIEGTEEPIEETAPAEQTENPRGKEQTERLAVPPGVSKPGDDKIARMKALKTEIDSLDSEIRATEEKEAGLVSAVNEKAGSRQYYNIIQLKQLEKEQAPLKQELHDVQLKKQELMRKRSSLVEEYNSLQ
jgi:hypothetical protein